MKKDGPNKGREFYKCPKQPACNFFEWADGTVQNTSFGGGPRPGGGGGGATTSGSNFQNARNFGNNGGEQQGQSKQISHSVLTKLSFLSQSEII